jgi:glucosamine--fructose-6-phosphate aminotransferase (isomerizing)
VNRQVSGTEAIDPRYAELDSWPTDDIVAALFEGQFAAAGAVRSALGAIAEAVDDAAGRLGSEGRLVYAGAGTSARIGVQDGTELTPTFNWPVERLLFLVAGGAAALTKSVEGAEDSADDGARAATEANIVAHDVVIGIAASGTTPYTVGALGAAREAGALTIGIAGNPGTPLLAAAQHPILIETGSEAIAGSTRLKAGTAQKIALNLFSTTLMVKLGRVYRGLMVDMRATNAKLRRRAEAVVTALAGCSPADAARFVETADGDVKRAVLLAHGMSAPEATRLLDQRGGNLRMALNSFPTKENEREESAMAQEIAQIPAAAARQLANSEAIGAAVARIRAFAPRAMVFCGRGSSGHVGVFLRYLFEARLGMIASAAAPSLTTLYGARADMRGALFIVVSQSGLSPDLVATTEAARERGALTLAIVNDVDAPVTHAAELVVPIEAGAERAVAATKTVALSMLAGARLVAGLANDEELRNALGRLPARFESALGCDWSSWTNALTAAQAGFVCARGYALAAAREIALKLNESLRLPALAWSAAELRHGPRAAVTPLTPVLALRPNDEAAASVDELARDLAKDGATLFTAGGPQSTLPWIGDDDSVCDTIAMLLPAYRAIEAAVRHRGFDPDRPPHLTKVTKTL